MVGVGECINLSYLNISSNIIEDISPMQSLIRLSTLKASDNKIKDISALITCKKLIKLKLNNNQIYSFERTLKTLKSLPRLLNLSLLANPCTGKIKDFKEKLCFALSLEKIDKEIVLPKSKEIHTNRERISYARTKLKVESLKEIQSNQDYQKQVDELKEENLILKKELAKVKLVIARLNKSTQVL